MEGLPRPRRPPPDSPLFSELSKVRGAERGRWEQEGDRQVAGQCVPLGLQGELWH